MNHIYALGLTMVFFVGGFTPAPAVKHKLIYDRLPETVFVRYPEKHMERLLEACNG